MTLVDAPPSTKARDFAAAIAAALLGQPYFRAPVPPAAPAQFAAQ